MSELSGVSVAIIGLGASGIASARLALDRGGDVYVSDLRTEPAIAAGGADLRTAGARVEMGGHDLERDLEARQKEVQSPWGGGRTLATNRTA